MKIIHYYSKLFTGVLRLHPASARYEFQSGGIVEMLEDLKEKFEDERRHLEKDEVGSEAETSESKI